MQVKYGFIAGCTCYSLSAHYSNNGEIIDRAQPGPEHYLHAAELLQTIVFLAE